MEYDKLPVVVSYERDGKEAIPLRRFATVKEAEDWIDHRSKIDPDGVESGKYSMTAMDRAYGAEIARVLTGNFSLVGDGHGIYAAEDYIADGLPAEFVNGISRRHVSGVEHTDTIYDDDGNVIDSMIGVSNIELLEAVAQQIDADYRPCDRYHGRGKRARCYLMAIRRKLGIPDDETG